MMFTTMTMTMTMRRTEFWLCLMSMMIFLFPSSVVMVMGSSSDSSGGATTVTRIEDVEGLNSMIHIMQRDEGTYSIILDLLFYTREYRYYDCVSECRNFTFFAPTNVAFDVFTSDEMDRMKHDVMNLIDIIDYHSTKGRYYLSDLEDGRNYNTYLYHYDEDATTGYYDTIEVTKSDEDGVRVNGASVVDGDVWAQNGIIHNIDQFLLPPHYRFYAEAPPTLAPVEPPSPAPSSTPEPSTPEPSTPAPSSTPEPSTSEPSTPAPMSESPTSEPSMLDVVLNMQELTTFAELLLEADLGSVLQFDDEPILLFAPVNEAFNNAVVRALKSDHNSLNDVLQYHMVPQSTGMDVLPSDGLLTTLEGSELLIEIAGDLILLNRNPHMGTFVQTRNGAIIVLDQGGILLPPSNLMITLESNGFALLSRAFEVAGLTDFLQNEDEAFTLFAPPDESFLANPLLWEDVGVLRAILLYHVVPGQRLLRQFRDGGRNGGTSLASVTDQTLRVGVARNHQNQFEVVINSRAHVTDFDIIATNGVVHRITEILVPPGAAVQAADDTSRLLPPPSTTGGEVDIHPTP